MEWEDKVEYPKHHAMRLSAQPCTERFSSCSWPVVLQRCGPAATMVEAAFTHLVCYMAGQVL